MIRRVLRLFSFVRDMESEVKDLTAEVQALKSINSALQYNENTLRESISDLKAVSDTLSLRCFNRRIYGENTVPVVTPSEATRNLPPARARDIARAAKQEVRDYLKGQFPGEEPESTI